MINEELAEARETYNSLMDRPQEIENILLAGAEKAREFSVPFLKQLREAMGIRKL